MARGRRKEGAVIRSFFLYNNASDVSKCHVCGKDVPGNHLGNLTKHIITRHRSTYDEYKDCYDSEVQNPSPPKKKRVTLELDPAEVENAWIDLIVKEGRPLVILDSKALRTLLAPIFGALEIEMLTSRNVQLAIRFRARKVMESIQSCLKHRIFSLKIDSATRHNRRIICLNAQAIINGQIKIFTLAMNELTIGNGSHTGQNIKLFVLAILQK